MTDGGWRMTSELMILRDCDHVSCLIYRLDFPDSEKYGLQNQTRRACISIALNLAEGNAFRNANKIRFFEMALGSCMETIHCIHLRTILFYHDFDSRVIDDLLDKIKRTIIALIASHRKGD